MSRCSKPAPDGARLCHCKKFKKNKPPPRKISPQSSCFSILGYRIIQALEQIFKFGVKRAYTYTTAAAFYFYYIPSNFNYFRFQISDFSSQTFISSTRYPRLSNLTGLHTIKNSIHLEAWFFLILFVRDDSLTVVQLYSSSYSNSINYLLSSTHLSST